jgi:hypothetical protein
MILPLALSASLPVVTGGEFFSPPREFMKVPPTYLQMVVGKGEIDKGDFADLSFKGSRSGLALLASVSFKMEFRIPILSQEAYSDTQRVSTLENFEESRLKSESAQQSPDADWGSQ